MTLGMSASERFPRFPVMLPHSERRRLLSYNIPWAMIAPHEAQALKNHGGQSLARLAERGGLAPCEALAVLEDRRWYSMDFAVAFDDLEQRVSAWLAELAA